MSVRKPPSSHSRRRPRVLLIAYAWPPRGGVGLLRARSLAQHLPEKGWDVGVLTPGAGAPATSAADSLMEAELEALGLPTVRAPWKSLPGPFGRWALPDFAVRWVWSAVRAGLRELEARPYDAILTTSPPPSMHVVGAFLSARTHLPWVADIRDSWSDYHYEARSRWWSKLDAVLERGILRRASAIVAVSDGLASKTATRIDRDVAVVPNGYMPPPGTPGPDGKKFVLRYLGQVHGKAQDWRGLLRAVATLAARRGATARDVGLELFLVGNQQALVMGVIDELGLSELVSIHDPVPHARALELMASATALPVFDWLGGPSGIVPTKLYEALATSRPVLLISAQGGDAEVLASRYGGVCPHSQTDLDDVLVALYDDFKRGRDLSREVAPTFESYRRDRLAARVVEILDGVAGSQHPEPGAASPGNTIVVQCENANRSRFGPLWAGGRQRLAQATGVRFVGPDRLLFINLVAQRMYLARIDRQRLEHSIIATVTTEYDGHRACTDLLDLDSDGRIITSNCDDNSASLYQLSGDELSHVRDIPIPDPEVGFCHGVSFVPGHPSVIAATTINGVPKVYFISLSTGEILHTIREGSWRAADVCFVSSTRMYVVYAKAGPTPEASADYPSKVTLIELAADLRGHEVISETHIERCQVDSIEYGLGMLWLGNQLQDRIHRFRVAGDELQPLPDIEGVSFPHGIDICEQERLVAVTSYGDNTIELIDAREIEAVVT